VGLWLSVILDTVLHYLPCEKGTALPCLLDHRLAFLGSVCASFSSINLRYGTSQIFKSSGDRYYLLRGLVRRFPHSFLTSELSRLSVRASYRRGMTSSTPSTSSLLAVPFSPLLPRGFVRAFVLDPEDMTPSTRSCYQPADCPHLRFPFFSSTGEFLGGQEL